MRYRLRTLPLWVRFLVAGVVLVGGYFAWLEYADFREIQLLKQEMREQWERDNPGKKLDPNPLWWELYKSLTN